jgi:hypothetical protein
MHSEPHNKPGVSFAIQFGDSAQWILAIRAGRLQMLGAIAIVLIIAWALGFFAFHITAGLIHIILVVAVILIVMHFITGRRRGI